ncbi:hypothetical protein POM88_002625 [Heracleum sosnowskyi]|uniref:Uncharacterized protein n=1 Tax=Heracleum sosnowskyi TaxID=360622 RepID=A0AAD8N629_9APIA|nr:hypothetical protein POM88_002625 [Heracleum sosnowskyi]
MLSELSIAKNLTFDLESIEALSTISDKLANKPSPFRNLNYVKLPHEYNESSLMDALRSYLLGGSSRGIIFTTLPQNTISHTEEHVVEDSVVDADRIGDIVAPVGKIGKDPVSSSAGNLDCGLWRGHRVNSEFVCLLDRIMLKYPKTFENFTTNNKKLRFNVSWAVSRLEYVEHLRFSNPLIPELNAIDCRIDDDKSKLQELQACVDDAKIKLQDLQARVNDAKTKLQDAQSLQMEKLTNIEKAFGTMGAKLAVGLIGDDLFV